MRLPLVKVSQKLGSDLDRLLRPIGGMLDLDFHLAVLAVVAEGAAEAALVLQVEGHAGINGQGIDVQADAASFGSIPILDLVDALQLVHAIDGAAGGAADRVQPVELNARSARQAIHAYDILMLRTVAAHIFVVMDRRLALRD